MNVFKKAYWTVKEKTRYAMWKAARFIYSTEVHVYPQSPYFPASTEVLAVYFNKFAYEAATLQTPMDGNGHVDVQILFNKFPGMHRLRVHYPDDWDNTLDHFNKKTKRFTGEHTQPEKEDTE